jgi:hypothetical protein
MKNFSSRVLPILSLAIVAAPSIAPIAQAAPFKDAAGVVYFQDAGQTVGQKLTIELTGTPVTKNATANQCGVLTVPLPGTGLVMPSSIKVGSTIVNVSSLSVAATPKCTLNSTTGVYALATPLTTNSKTIEGKVLVIGQTPSLGQVVEYTGLGKSKTVTADKCSMAKLGSTSAPAPSSFKFMGNDYSLASLSVGVPNRCIGGVRYAPVGGGSGSGS